MNPSIGNNENLAAQHGVLFKHDWSCRDFWLPRFEQPVITTRPQVNALIDTRFIRFELPWDQAEPLLLELAKRGSDGASTFPGAHGMVRRVLDYAWLGDRVSDFTQRIGFERRPFEEPDE